MVVLSAGIPVSPLEAKGVHQPSAWEPNAYADRGLWQDRKFGAIGGVEHPLAGRGATADLDRTVGAA